MIKNRYNYPTPPIRDIKGKERGGGGGGVGGKERGA